MAATGGVATATVASSNLSFQKDDPMKNQHVYMLFAREVGPLVKNKYPTIQKMQFNQILGRIWNELPPVEKNKYYVKADVQRKIQMNNHQGQAPVLPRPSQPIAASPGPDSKITAPSGRTITTRPYERQKELSPYEIYSKGTKTILMKQYPYLNSRELELLVIRMWSQLSPEEKDRYNRLSVKTPDPVSNNPMSHSNNAVEFINKVGVKVSEETADKTENIFMRGDSDSEDDDDAEETLNEQSTPPDTRSEEEIAIANIQPKTEPELPIMENVEDLNNSGSVEEEENGLNGKQAGNENDAKDTKEDNDEEEEEEEQEENVDVDPLENDIKTTTTTYKLKTGEVVKSAKNNSENNEGMSSSGGVTIVQGQEGGHHHGGQTTPVEVTVSQCVDQGGQVEAESGERIDEKNEEEEKKQSFDFPCSDIRYRLLKKEKNTALSLFIFSPLNSNVKRLMNKIEKIQRRSKQEQVGDNNHIVRIDYIFKNEKEQKTFRDKVVDLPRPQDLILVLESIPEELLLPREAPIVTEEELLWIFSESLAENTFRGFSVRLLENENGLSFDFGSMIALNMFLTETVGYRDAFLGGVRRSPKSSLAIKVVRKFGKVTYPLRMKLNETFDFKHLEAISKKYKFKVFTKNDNIHKQYATLDFKTKNDLYYFVICEDVEFFLQTKSK